MDRDMVNCLHYLYHWGQITLEQLKENEPDPRKKPFWCGPDTRHPLEGHIIRVEEGTGSWKLSSGVYDLIEMVEDQLRSMPKPDYAFGYPIRASIRTEGAPRPAFLAISYKPEFDLVKLAVQEAAKHAGFVLEVTGDLETPGDIMDQVWRGIRGSDAVVADITGKNANVFYEIGLAHALGKEVILISQDAEVPFDIRSFRRFNYDAKDVESLKTALVAAFRAVSARYPHEGEEPEF